MNTIPHWINGTPVPGENTQAVFNPATGQEQARVVLGGAAEIDAAVVAATAAFETWAESSLAQRTQVMFAFRQLLVEHEEELGRIISAEHGKTVDDARGEITRGREVVEFACGLGDVLKGPSRTRCRAASTCTTSGSRWGSSRASRPSTSLPWCLFGCTRWPSPPATPSS